MARKREDRGQKKGKERKGRETKTGDKKRIKKN